MFLDGTVKNGRVQLKVVSSDIENEVTVFSSDDLMPTTNNPYLEEHVSRTMREEQRVTKTLRKEQRVTTTAREEQRVTKSVMDNFTSSSPDLTRVSKEDTKFVF